MTHIYINKKIHKYESTICFIVEANSAANYIPEITLKIGPEIIKNKPVMPIPITSSNVVINFLLSKTFFNYSSNYYLYYSLSNSIFYFTSFYVSYIVSRLIGSTSYSREYYGVCSTYIIFLYVKNHSYTWFHKTQSIHSHTYTK